MCGIAGYIGLPGSGPPDPGLLKRMVGAVAHRGPDEFGIYADAVAALGHARLSIIDLSGGMQPMANEDRSVWLVFNGEIFNHVELQAELEALGHRFRTRSDTEVLLHAYEAWGDRFVERLNGQFALAIWDRKRQRLLLTRDRLGIRPLYHARYGKRFYFASEVKSIFADTEFPRRFDPEGIDQVFTFWTSVAPATPFEGVRELRPGHTLVLDLNTVSDPAPVETEYWRPRFPEAGAACDLSLADATSGLLDRLRESTRLRMIRSDVPVGSYLSGGIDSSLIAALGRQATDGEFRTFSIRFSDAEFDETTYQRMMVDLLGSHHHEIMCNGQEIAESFPDVIAHGERPVLRTAPAPLFLLSGLVRENGFKVVLTGEGSDEILAGYDIFREAKVRRFWGRNPQSTWRPLLLDRLYPYLARSPVASRAMARKFFGQGIEQLNDPAFSHRPRWGSAANLKRMFSSDTASAVAGIDAVGRLLADLPEDAAGWDPLSMAQYLEVRTLLSGYLLSSQGDRMLMAHSVEGRFPFLDHHVVEYCNSLPPRYKLRVLDEKHVLKRCAAELVPQEILDRPKQPYRAPDAPGFLGEKAPAYVADVLSDAAVEQAGVFEVQQVRRLVAKCENGVLRHKLSNTDNMAFIGVLSTQLLWDRLIRTPPESASLDERLLKTQVLEEGVH
ncbi:MAG: asparagine synthase (glutamine-hydrolyzing) [Acidobacteria bacterium]|uniref:asparagine synthase (glutamine-hydrolyzing) n=1 Tax=Candidatus Polarisedimenticola svalbardensis TaxID=2886004 RepID=A0A8J7CDK9_9BACT|nr:asparagine synthase (glutamine-hydrolyzing) [Candidatus Polarisedimenticola svalbardensis]